MSQVFSEETHRNLLARIPHCTGRDIADWLRTVDEGPALFRFEEKVSWLRSEHNLAYGHAKAIVHEYDLRRAARKLLSRAPPHHSYDEEGPGCEHPGPSSASRRPC